MIGYETGSLPPNVGVYAVAEISPVETSFKLGWKNDTVVNLTSITFCWGSSLHVKFLGQPQILGQETWPPENSNSRPMFVIPSIASNNLDFG